MYEKCYKICEADATCGCFSVGFETAVGVDAGVCTPGGYNCYTYPLMANPYDKSSWDGDAGRSCA